MPRVHAELHLPDARHAEAAALWWDPARWPSFVDGFSHVHRRDETWPAAGGRLVWDARRESDRGRIAERVERRDGTGGGEVTLEVARLEGTQTVRFTQTGRGTLVTLELRYAPKGAGAPLADLVYVRRRLRRALRTTLERFAREVAMERELAARLQ
jgi:uncharacterized membrane protein